MKISRKLDASAADEMKFKYPIDCRIRPSRVVFGKMVLPALACPVPTADAWLRTKAWEAREKAYWTSVVPAGDTTVSSTNRPAHVAGSAMFWIAPVRAIR